MNIRKQDVHSVFSKVFQVKDDNYLTLTVMSAFLFDDPGTLVDESDLWNAAGSALSKNDVLDMLMPKQTGEVLAAGTFFNLSAQSVQAGSVRISIGPIDKTLHIFGDRYWIKKAGMVGGISDPQPLTEMEITYVNAFGGPGYKWNPLGKGMEEHGSGDAVPLPNIEYPNQLIASPSDRPEPAGFGPLGPDWQQRAGKLGTYDRKWLETRWPWFPEDMDWTYFNAAPHDQQTTGYFTGDERVVIENMHPERSTISTSLPALRMRCFVRQEENGDEIFKELGTRLDTVWLFPEYETGVVIWRGTLKVRDDEAADIQAAYAAHEYLMEDKKPLEYYRDIFFAESAEEAAVEESETAVPPPEEAAPTVEPVKPRAAEPVPDPETAALIKDLEDRIADSEAQLTAELKKQGIDIEQLMKEVPLVAGLAMTDSSAPPAELSIEGLEKELAAKEAELAEMVRKLGFDPDVLSEVPKEVPQKQPPSMKEIVEAMRESGVNDPEAEQYLLELEKERGEAEQELSTLLEEEKKREAELKKEEPLEGERVEKELEPEVEEVFTRETVVERYEAGKSFAGKDLSGLDLSGLDLAGVDFSGALLDKVDLSKTNLREADLSGAVLSGAIMLRTHLSHARLPGCNLTQVHAREIDLSHAEMNEADMSNGSFEGASFVHTHMTYVLFGETILTGARFDKAFLQWADFTGADLTDAVFEGADLSRVDFSETILGNTDFSGVRAPSATFDGAKGKYVTFKNGYLQGSRADETTSLARTDFQRCDLSDANWAGADLTSSIFRNAVLTKADFSGCILLAADFYRSIAHKANFSRADLTDANMTSINLFRGDLSRAKLIRTDLKGSNLFEVEFFKIVVNKTNFYDANLKRTKLASWVPT
jgi:uncharacterized protein YjbI with pentapeptide repeats